MASKIVSTGNLKATITGAGTLTGNVDSKVTMKGTVGIPKIIENTYTAGNGIVIENKVISIDDLILDCGTSTTVI